MQSLPFQTPDIFYVVARNFTSLGFGSGGDLTDDFDAAYDQFADAVREDDPVRVFRIEMDADNMPALITDATHEARAVYDRIAAERGLETAE